MDIIEPKFDIVSNQGESIESMLKFITFCAYTCYKTEKIITTDVATKFVDGLIKSGHTAMLEHGTVFLAIPADAVNGVDAKPVRLLLSKQLWTRYTEKIIDGKMWLMIVTNFRVIVENNLMEFMKKRWYCPTKDEKMCRPTVKFTADIHFYKDCTRHRVFSWAIESTRWCNYIKDKFGHSVTFMKPSWLKEDDFNELQEDCKIIESIYFKWIEKGYPQECAAYFLSQGVKADVIMTGFVDDWEDFFNKRALGKTGKPHPDVVNLVKPLYEEFKNRHIISNDEISDD